MDAHVGAARWAYVLLQVHVQSLGHLFPVIERVSNVAHLLVCLVALASHQNHVALLRQANGKLDRRAPIGLYQVSLFSRLRLSERDSPSTDLLDAGDDLLDDLIRILGAWIVRGNACNVRELRRR